MSLLLDTNIFLWAVGERKRLKPRVVELLERENEVLYLSAVSACEIAIKWSLGKLELPDSPLSFVNDATKRMGCSQLPVSFIHGAGVANLPYHHRDPWDRLIIAQARATGFRIVTSDREFKNYDVELVMN